MSKEKVLTLRGKTAVWAPAPAGVGGGGGFVVTLTAKDDSYTSYTADKTPAEIAAAVAEGKAVYALVPDAMGNWVCPLNVCIGEDGATFSSFGVLDESSGQGQIKYVVVFDVHVMVTDYTIAIAKMS